MQVHDHYSCYACIYCICTAVLLVFFHAGVSCFKPLTESEITCQLGLQPNMSLHDIGQLLASSEFVQMIHHVRSFDSEMLTHSLQSNSDRIKVPSQPDNRDHRQTNRLGEHP